MRQFSSGNTRTNKSQPRANTTGEWHLTRRYERVQCSEHPIDVKVRLPGKLRRTRAALLDFNTHSAALLVPKLISSDGLAFVSLRWRDICIDQLVCNISSCVRSGAASTRASAARLGYRCGLIFRVQSPHQFDRLETQEKLRELESQLASATAPGGISALSA